MFKYFTLVEGGLKTPEKKPGKLLGKSDIFSNEDPDFEKTHLNAQNPKDAKETVCDILRHSDGEITPKEMYDDIKKGGGRVDFKNQTEIEAFCAKHKGKLNTAGNSRTVFFLEETIGGEKKNYVVSVIMKDGKMERYLDPLTDTRKYSSKHPSYVVLPPKPPAPPAP
jgi:hypothetical protein